MKFFRFILSLPAVVFWACLAQAESPWGLLSYVAEDPVSFTYAVDNLIDKRPIRYAVEGKITPEEEKIFQENILKWPAETLRLIQKSGRAQEFKDIVPVLQHQLAFTKVARADSPDVVLSYADQVESSAQGHFDRKDEKHPCNEIIINANSRADFAYVSLHEIGHYFGLGDQYEAGRLNSHAEYSSNANHQEKSIMHGVETISNNLTCDDADGIINLIDLRLSQRRDGQFSDRAKKGWKSLCPHSQNLYQEARTINRTDDVSALDIESWSTLTSRQYTQGRLTRETYVFLESPLQLFFFTDDDKVTRDPNTHLVTEVITTLKGKTGFPTQEKGSPALLVWKKQFSYQPSTQRQGQKVIPVQVTEWLDEKKLREREVFITSNGGLQNMPMRLDEDFLKVTNAVHKILFKIENREIVKFGIFDDEREINVIGTPNDGNLYVSYDNGEHFKHYSLLSFGGREPVLPGQLQYFYFDVYQPHRDYLLSFYQNFYEPLFGKEAAQAAQPSQAEQTRNQVKQSLGAAH